LKGEEKSCKKKILLEAKLNPAGDKNLVKLLNGEQIFETPIKGAE
jgi:hypothetical protein